MAKLKPRFFDGGCILELVDVVRDRGLTITVNFQLGTMEATIFDRHSAECTQMIAGTELDGLAGFFELCRRERALYQQARAVGVMSAEELRDSMQAALDACDGPPRPRPPWPALPPRAMEPDRLPEPHVCRGAVGWCCVPDTREPVAPAPVCNCNPRETMPVQHERSCPAFPARRGSR